MSLAQFRQIVGNGSANSNYGASPDSQRAALADCIRQGASNCEIHKEATKCIYRDNGASTFRGLPWVYPTYECTSVATGTIETKGREISDRDVKKLKKEKLCDAISECLRSSTFDSDATREDLEKLDYSLKQNQCN